MITVILLILAVLAAITIGLFTLLVGGAGFLLVFGDLIIAVFIIIGIVKLIRKRKK